MKERMSVRTKVKLIQPSIMSSWVMSDKHELDPATLLEAAYLFDLASRYYKRLARNAYFEDERKLRLP
jgi:hypothetical protein